MTQPPANTLHRIERLLSAGKQQEARLLLMEYIKLNPASAHAWWLMSLTLTDRNQEMDCLQRVLRLDPENEPARERLAKLISQPSVSPSVSPFTASDPAVPKEPTGDALLPPDWAVLPGLCLKPYPSNPQRSSRRTPYRLLPSSRQRRCRFPASRKRSGELCLF